MISLLFTRKGMILAAVGVSLALAGALYVKGRNDATRAAHEAALEAEIETQERINHADSGNGDFVDDARWLRERGGRY